MTYIRQMTAVRTKVMIFATLAVWITAFIAWTADWYAMSFPFGLQRAAGRGIMCMIGMATCGCLYQILTHLELRTWSYRIATGAGLALLASAIYAGCSGLVFQFFNPAWETNGLAEGIRTAVGVSWVFFLWIAIFFIFQMAADAQEARLKLAEVSAAEFKGRYEALASQIHPHFLFNALNTVSALILDGAYDKAERTTLSLASLLRHSLEADPSGLVPLEQELSAVRRYLEIVQVRFETRLNIVEDIPASLLKTEIPQLLIQPLVENVIRHGVSRTSDRVTLTLQAEAIGSDLCFRVLDDAISDSRAPENPGSGIGQENIRKRLKLMFEGRASLECVALPRGYLSALRLPLETRLYA
ncbi:histidine kinase [Asticcacaulis sp. DXS10W]|uniref:Histidine kinase n=1 Tax=Asticcacaulis currens TaxID=2984210 RepID=A0ABT5IDL5_9CAUL|nr:histidine kinase [Asticcacaulis currens]MDC7694263.1 histidine kinase [Asticcacaulis currens]